MTNIFLEGQPWNISRDRQIDDATLCDMLSIIEYQSERINVQTDIGIQDLGEPTEVLFTYVLDALGVPAAGVKKRFSGEHARFDRELSFSRDWFEERFYSDYLLENDQHKWTYKDLLEMFRKEVAESLDEHYL